MIINDTDRGVELEICEDPDVFFEDCKGKKNAIFVIWSELDEVTQRELSERTSKAEELLERGAKVLS